MAIKFRLLNEDEIDVRVGNVIKTAYREGANLLLYKNARVDMDILDETVGAENWTRGHQEIKGNLYCNVSIYNGKEWVTKQDCGVESNTEKEKGEASDSFKRACVNWGIGRELYTAPPIFINWETEQIERGGKKVNILKYAPTFDVKKITYDDKRRINSLIITATSGSNERQQTKDVFNWAADKTVNNIAPAPDRNSKPTLEQAQNYVLRNGKFEGMKFSECPEYYLNSCSEKCTGMIKEYADLILKDIKSKKRDIFAEIDEDDDLPFKRV